MKKYFVFVTILFGVFFVLSTGVSAAEGVQFSLKTDENIKEGQTFNLYLSADSNADIGVFRISVEFDDNLLTFKSARLSDEYKDRYMRYENHGNRIIIIYINNTQSSSKSLKDCIKLRFSPLNNDSESYIFKTSIYETGDINAKPLECNEMPSLSLKVTQNGSSTDTSYSKVTSKPQGTISQHKTSSIDMGSSESTKNPINSDNTISAQYSLPENHEYSLSENGSDISFKQDYFYFIAGAVILVAVVAIVAFKLGAKNKYYNSDDKNKK